jgi:hypothetical protein
MAAQLGIAPRTLREWCRLGYVPHFKLPGKSFSNGEHEINRGTLLFDPEQVFCALAKFAVNQPRPPKRRAVRLTEIEA